MHFAPVTPTCCGFGDCSFTAIQESFVADRVCRSVRAGFGVQPSGCPGCRLKPEKSEALSRHISAGVKRQLQTGSDNSTVTRTGNTRAKTGPQEALTNSTPSLLHLVVTGAKYIPQLRSLAFHRDRAGR